MNVFRSVCRTGRLVNKLYQLPKLAAASLPALQSRQFSDSALTSALSNEIAHEEGAVTNEAGPQHLTEFTKHVTGSRIVLEKPFENETIKVELDLNNMTELAPAEDDPEETPPQYLPSFKIEISKKQGVLVFHCNYHMATEEQNLDQFVISEVAFSEHGQEENTAFTTDFGNLDYVLIEEFERYLHRRGLGAEFSSGLFEMSSAFEHENYVSFLKNVRDFL